MRINLTLTKEEEEAIYERIGRLGRIEPGLDLRPGEGLHYFIKRGIAAWHEDVRATNERDRQLQDETVKRARTK